MSEPDAISVPEAAKRLGIGKNTAWDLVHREDNPLPHVRIGRRVVVPVAKLQAWLEESAA